MAIASTAGMDPEKRLNRPWWRASFAPLGLAVVAVALVFFFLMPLLQRSGYAPPGVVGHLGEWGLHTPAGESVGPWLEDKVVLVTVPPTPCAEACVAEQRELVDELRPTEEVAESIRIVTLAPRDAAGGLQAVDGGDRWRVATGSDEQLMRHLEAIRSAWATFAASDGGVVPPGDRPGVVLVDQNRDIRGVWSDHPTGRTNAAQASRLLVEQGP